MKLAKKIIAITLGILLVIAGIGHFLNPEMYFPLTPDFLPKYVLNALAGGVEILLGVGALVPLFRRMALLGIFILMIIFLPIHILDALKDQPVIGTKTVAFVRIGVQLVLIYLPWFARKHSI